ncbi:CHAT domain-containing tetratricopeptide repeat protein [Corallococcus sp. Z5C101001]|uniref:CHAT domain-containing tetratricopeptide repeat protein n=1 Tax=Corallococcus sp. Z5C101001 TaxID=2596829 RepID=UPI001180F633|nr:CHAT domain-containing tetratricopeptide repeat protein [Corallococcus sp. Z5C101001]TSC29338.1 CHAT domain-containing protein [Corallococcus sp. Z5C101001]
MRWILGWMVVLALGCAARMPAGVEGQLLEAQRTYDAALALYDAGRYAEAVAPGERSLALREAVFGGAHREVATCLNLLGEAYRLQGDFARAGVVHERALAIREAAVSDDAVDSVVVSSLLAFAASPVMEPDRQPGGYYSHEHALSRRQNNLFSLDKRRRTGAMASQEAVLSENQFAYAQSLNNLAMLYQDQGLYSRAEPLYVRALELRETVLGMSHLTVADSLNNLALLYREQGLYGRAEPLYVRALSIRESALGKAHPSVADSLDTLATLYQDQGQYGRAEPLYERARSIREESLGKRHPRVADSLNNLANLYQDQGLYDRAEPLYTRALSIREAAPDGNPSDLAASLNNLATLYQAQGLIDRAEPLFARALVLWETSLGKRHPHVAALLNNLATLYRKQGRYDRAEPLYVRALSIWEEVLGRNHPDVAGALSNLANLYRDQGQYGRAEPLYERALAIREAVLGRNHPDLAASLNNLALLRLAQRRLDAAVPLFTRAFAVSEQRLRREALEFSEARLASFLQLLRVDEEHLYALLRAHPESAEVRRLALSAALLLKGRSVEETADISRAVYRSLGDEERGTFARLRGLRSQLASLSLHGPGALPPSAYQRQLEALATQGDALEATLARRSAPLRALAALPAPEDIVDRVAAALPEDGALVEFITYEDRPLVPGARTSSAQLRCMALVLLPDASIRTLDLGLAEPIEAAASRMRDALARRDAAFDASSQALYQLAFQPLLPLLGKAHRLFLSPDGQLALVPFAALHDGQRFLVDTYDFTYLTSGKDLLPRPQPPRSASSVVVLADPAFRPGLQATAEAPASADAWAERSAPTRPEDLRMRDWAPVPLPGSREEAEAIQRLFPQAQLYLGPKATKERLLRMTTPGILHLATHGFFLEDAATQENTRAIAHFGALGEDARAPRPPDPLLRSGLLLAGERAQAASSASDSGASPDSSLVTALELAGLDLWGTQLVVLSACDTGRGDVRRGQGVYGLRRAFLVAGAETVVMSLWKVDDATTRTLMETYYRHLLAGQGLATALREAMRELRQAQPHPHYWAPFIAMGRDTPLRLLEAAARQP